MIEILINIAQQAGNKLLEYYDSGKFTIETKTDDSPVTEADLASNQIIMTELAREFSFPILSEEEVTPFSERKNWETLWLVDPLDGTKSFVDKTDEFSVNIALIKHGQPVLGVIHLPAEKNTYYAELGSGAYKLNSGIKEKIFNSRESKDLIGIASRTHITETDNQFFLKNGVKEVLRSGGSAKFCRVAEGKADIYSRFGPTSEWDVAPGEILLYEAGCKMLDAQTGKRLEYNKENLQNPFFIAFRSDINYSL
ncbi:MAG: 3'(2'),5'-bisphosphate nucleotidase CysQ [Bdellovibrionota bacterium]